MSNVLRSMPWPFSGSRWAFNLGILFSSLCLPGLVGCQQKRLPGHVVGNGGGLLQQRFEAGRENARDVVLRLSDERLTQIGIASQPDDKWLVDHRVEVAQEISQLKWADPEHPITSCPQHGPKWCLCTTPQLGAPVTISETGCAANPSVEDAGGLMLHEALHHFLGDDEARVYRLSSLVYHRWSALAAYHAPVFISSPEAGNGASISSWDGKELLTWNPMRDAEIHRYSPVQRSWEGVELTPRPPWVRGFPEHVQRAALLPYGDEHVFLVGQRGDVYDDVGGTDLRDVDIDLKNGSWRMFNRTVLPNPRREAEILTDAPVSNGKWQHGLGALNGLLKRAATVLPEVSVDAWALFPGLVNAFFDKNPNIDFYTPYATETALFWQKINGPEPLRWKRPIVIGNARGVLFYNCQTADHSVANAGGGWWLDANQGEWQAIAPGGPEPYRGRILAAPDGDSIHIVGKQWMVWSLRRHTWETVQADAGSFSEWATRLYMTSSGALFWDDRAGRGMVWAR